LLVTDDCQKSYEDFASRGVEFQVTPEERPYGIDAGFRDPSGNNFRPTSRISADPTLTGPLRMRRAAAR
jgi:hypothetical protein